MKNPRGAQRKHWAEKARVWVWYWLIQRTCGWDYVELDNEFAWTEKGKKERVSMGLSEAGRPRTFERIEKEARQPEGSGDRWRSMSRLVDAVDQHPWFSGSKFLYEAELWTMFQETTITPAKLQSRIERLLDRFDLVRVSYEKLGPRPDLLTNQHGPASIYDQCLLLSMCKMHPWYKIELVWCLYIQNESAHNWEIRALLDKIADSLLDDFFRIHLPDLDRSRDYYLRAYHALISTRLDMSSKDGGYGTIETLGQMPVLPRELVGKVDEDLLFGWLHG